MDAVDEVAIDLHVIRTQFRPHPKARIAGAEIVEGDAEAHRAVVMQGLVQQFEIIGRRLFGQLDDHLLGRDAVGIQQLQGAAGLVRRFEQGLGEALRNSLPRNAPWL